MIQTLKWLLDLDKTIPGGSPGDTYRQGYEFTLSQRDRKIEQGLQWAVDEAEKKLTPPSTAPVLDAAEKALIGPNGLDWASIQLMMFFEMSRQRQRGQTACPLSFTDIKSYQHLNRVKLHPVELNNILVLDNVFMDFVSEMIEQQMAEAKNKTQGAS